METVPGGLISVAAVRCVYRCTAAVRRSLCSSSVVCSLCAVAVGRSKLLQLNRCCFVSQLVKVKIGTVGLFVHPMFG